MSYDEPIERPSLVLRILGWAVLLLGLPVALIGALAPPNEYEAIFGIDALDCDGPFGVYLFAVPALFIYGVASVINGLRWRRPKNLAVAIVGILICGSLSVNLARAVAEDRDQAQACQMK